MLQKRELNVSKAQINTAQTTVQSSDAQIGVIETQLKHTRIYAPMNGVVARRWLMPGDIVQAGQSVFTITNNQSYWVIVYLEETNLAQVHIGQRAIFSVDAIPGVNFIGKVYEIGSNTAGEFSLIPPNNASGNFTKVTQRIPVKVSVDGTEKGISPSNFKFLSGMSVVIKIVKG